MQYEVEGGRDMSLKESIYTLAFPSGGMKSLSSGLEKAGIKGVFPQKIYLWLVLPPLFFFWEVLCFF